MIIIKSLIFTLIFLFAIYRYGIVVSYFIKNNKKTQNFLYGFIGLIGINQILLTPCVLLHISFKVAFWLITITNIAIVIISFYIKRRKIKKINREQSIMIIVICILTIFQIVLSTISYKSNADDSYYVSLSLTNIDSEAIYTTEPSMGEDVEGKLPFDATELIPTIELQIAIWCKAFSISPVIMCHSVLPMLVIMISYLAYYNFANTLLNKKSAKVFVIILEIIFIFTGFSTRFRPGYLLTRGWQGKTIFLNIGLTTILATLIKSDKKLRKEDILKLILTNLFSISLSSTAIFLVPFTYIAFGILKLIQRKWKDIINLIISFIPIIIYVLILFLIIKSSDGALTVERDGVDILQLIKYYQNYTFLGYYIISTIIIMFIGSKKAKVYFGAIQIINLLTIWNPILSNFIAKYLTSSAIFWRVLWLIPIEFSIAYAITICIEKIKNTKLKIVTVITSIAIIIVSGKFIYNFELTRNLENIPREIIDNTNYILEQGKEKDKITVLAPQEPWHSTTMRQLTNKIKLINSRAHYMKKLNDKEIQDRINLSQIYNNQFIYNSEEFINLINKYKIDWIIIDKNNNHLKEYIENTNMKKDCEIGGYILYQNAGNVWN